MVNNKEIRQRCIWHCFEIARKNIPDIKSALKIISIPQSSEELQRLKEENYDIDNKSITSFYSGLVDDCIKEFQLMSKLRGNSNIVSYEDHNVMKSKTVNLVGIFLSEWNYLYR